MIKAIVDVNGDLLYRGDVTNEKFSIVAARPGSEIVDTLPPGDEDHWNGSVWSKKPRFDHRPSKGSATGNSIPALRADVDAIWQVLEDLGFVKP